MAVSLKKSIKVDLSKPELPPKVREYTPAHLMDEEESIQKRVRQITSLPYEDSKIQIKSESGGKSDTTRIKYVSSHLAEKSIQKSDGKTEPPTDENDDFTEVPKSIPKRIAKKILGKLDDIWFEIKGFPLIVLTVTFVMSLLLIPFLSNMMGEIAFDLSAVETSAEIVSIGTAENKDRQGVVVMFTDIYGNEQRSNILINKSANIKIGDIISIRYDPDNAEKVSVGTPIMHIDLKDIQ